MLSSKRKMSTLIPLKNRFPQARLKRTPSLPIPPQSNVSGPIKAAWTGKWDGSPYEHNEDTLFLNPFTPKDYSKPHIETIFPAYELDEFEPSSKRTGAIVDLSTAVDISKTGKQSSKESTVIQGLSDDYFKLIRCDTDEHGDVWSSYAVSGGNSIKEEWPETPKASTEKAARPTTGNLEGNTSAKKETPPKAPSVPGRSKTKRFFASVKRLFCSKCTKPSDEQRPTRPLTIRTLPASQTAIDTEITTPSEPSPPGTPPYPATLVGLLDIPTDQEMPPPPPKSILDMSALFGPATKLTPSRSLNSPEDAETSVMIRELPAPQHYFNYKKYLGWQVACKAKDEAAKEKKIQDFIDDDFPLMLAMEFDTWKDDKPEKPITKELHAYISRILASAELKYSWGRSRIACDYPDLLAQIEGSFRLDKGKGVALRLGEMTPLN
jgi:hypothetical protein